MWCFYNFLGENMYNGPGRRKAEVAPFGTASASIISNPWINHLTPDPEPSSCFFAWRKGSLPPAQIFSFSSFYRARSFPLHLAWKVKGEVIVVRLLAGVEVTQHFMLRIFQTPCGKSFCGRLAGKAAPQILSVSDLHFKQFKSAVIHTVWTSMVVFTKGKSPQSM